jgi:hypothetical protein
MLLIYLIAERERERESKREREGVRHTEREFSKKKRESFVLIEEERACSF